MGQTYGTFGSYAPGDVLKIVRDNGLILYYHNGNLKYSRVDPQPNSTALVDFSFYEYNRSIYGLKITKNSTATMYTADVISYSDYSPYGTLLDSRHGNDNTYRYGYQGSERDDEMKGSGNSYTTEFRQLDPRLGRWLTIDPKAASMPWQSPYCSMDNNPIWFNDPLGDIVKYKDFKSRVATFFGRIANKEYNSKFKEFKRDKDNTFTFDYDGKKWDSDSKKYSGAADNSSGFVSKESKNAFTVHFLKTPNDPTGSSKWSSLYEESYRIDDALGGKIFGGTNKTSFAWTPDGTLGSKSTLGFTEVDAWIWRADNDKIKTTYQPVILQPTGDKVKVRVKENLMQQIHKTADMDFNKRRKVVRNYLYGSYLKEFEDVIDSAGNKQIFESVIENGPYKK